MKRVPVEFQYVQLDELLHGTYDHFVQTIEDLEKKMENVGPGAVTNATVNAIREEVLKAKKSIATNLANLSSINEESKTEDKKLNDRINQLNDRFDSENGLQMYHYMNEAPYIIETAERNIMIITVNTSGNTNMVCDYIFTGTATESCELTFKIIINGQTLIYKPVFHLKQGLNTIGFPYGVPKIQSGNARIEVYLCCSNGSFKIEPYNFQATFTGSQIIGGESKIGRASCRERVCQYV